MTFKLLQCAVIAAAASSVLAPIALPQDAASARLAERGAAVFDHWCAPCHSPGPAMPGTQALQAKYNGSLPAVLVERSDLTPELIAFYVRNGISVMPFFRKTEISDTDLEALTRYIVTTARSAR